jgi:hypothetical protein
MKATCLQLIFSIGISCFCSAIPFENALKKGWIKEETKWKVKSQEETSSLRHGSNLSITLINLTSNTFTIEIPSGTLFTAVDSSKQNMLLTENLQVDLLPLQSKTSFCNVYCTEAKDGAPNDNDRYETHKPAIHNLQKLANFVNQKKYEGYGVQRAIWCISNSNNLSDISASDTSQLRELIYFTGNLANYKPAEIEKAFYKAASGGKEFEKLITLEIPIHTDESEIWIVIQNINNITQQTVMKRQKVGKGLMKKQFGVSSIDLGTGDFVVRVYSTDMPVVAQKFSLKS